MSSCSINICWKDSLFSIKFPLLFFQSLIDSICVGQFLGSPFCSMNLFVYSFANTIPFLINVISMNFNTRVDLCNQHNNQHMEQFHHSKKKKNFLMFSPYTPISYSLMSGNHQSIFQHSDFSFLWVSDECNHMIYGLLRLASISQHNGFGGSSLFKWELIVVPYYGWGIFHGMDIASFVYSFFLWETFGLFSVFGD